MSAAADRPPPSAGRAAGPGSGPRVVVVGGGLAGIAAARRCRDAGLAVTLLEGRPRLGGRTASFRRGELTVDTGQHVFMRCCQAYLGLLDRLGSRDQVRLQHRLDIPVVAPGRGRDARIYRSAGPAPLHLAPALARYRLLTLRERVWLARAVLALRRVDPAGPGVDDTAFGSWLSAHGQSPAAVEAIWDLVNVATLNAPAAGSSLALAATVFQLGLLTEADAADLGWADVPLGRLHGEAAQQRLAEAGVTVRTGAKVQALRRGPRDWAVRPGGDEAGELVADAVVLAVPPAAAERLLPGGAIGLPAGWSGRLADAPIVNVHLVYDRVVLERPVLAAVGSPLQWVFDRSRPSGLAGGQYLAVSLSAATELIRLPSAVLIERMTGALADLLPATRSARLLDRFVTREPAATFRPAPGTAAWRPPARTRLPGLYLAGAWTATGWPDTMESAVRSGNAAAAAVLGDLGSVPHPQPSAERAADSSPPRSGVSA